ncbi:hypothetical protein Dip510_000035 [Elusimicrobium posterum]|uniref:hypothetical protein n=1 Tax=Elusimicrobium posterum TaxID=3116653 RepID=UPI003C70ED3E
MKVRRAAQKTPVKKPFSTLLFLFWTFAFSLSACCAFYIVYTIIQTVQLTWPVAIAVLFFGVACRVLFYRMNFKQIEVRLSLIPAAIITFFFIFNRINFH